MILRNLRTFVRPAIWAGIVLLAATGPRLAADSLSGRVLDPQGAAVAQAQVTLLNRTSGELRNTVASAAGEYRFDEVPAGIGFSQKLFELHDQLIKSALELVSECPCADGCPSCVGPGGENGMGGKQETLAILKQLAVGG